MLRCRSNFDLHLSFYCQRLFAGELELRFVEAGFDVEREFALRVVLRRNQFDDRVLGVGMTIDFDPLRHFDGRDFNCVSNNGTKANPCLSADLFGDWREEIIARTADSKELRIFSTAIPTEIKLYTLMHNPQYRLSIAWQNVAYNQPPHVSYFIGEGMKTPAKPTIIITTKK